MSLTKPSRIDYVLLIADSFIQFLTKFTKVFGPSLGIVTTSVDHFGLAPLASSFLDGPYGRFRLDYTSA